MGQGTACPNSLPQAATDLSLLVTHTKISTANCMQLNLSDRPF